MAVFAAWPLSASEARGGVLNRRPIRPPIPSAAPQAIHAAVAAHSAIRTKSTQSAPSAKKTSIAMRDAAIAMIAANTIEKVRLKASIGYPFNPCGPRR